MRKRLIELLRNIPQSRPIFGSRKQGKTYTLVTDVADHLLANNVVVLPCKVGDTVYMPWEWKDTSGVAILTVERLSITEAGLSIRTDLWSDDEDYWLAYNCGVFKFDNIGETVFLTKEEAEKALAEMKGGDKE